MFSVYWRVRSGSNRARGSYRQRVNSYTRPYQDRGWFLGCGSPASAGRSARSMCPLPSPASVAPLADSFPAPVARSVRCIPGCVHPATRFPPATAPGSSQFRTHPMGFLRTHSAHVAPAQPLAIALGQSAGRVHQCRSCPHNLARARITVRSACAFALRCFTGHSN
jgi:hypothetical protein